MRVPRGQVAHRHAVRVRRDHAECAVHPGHQDAGQQGPSLVVRRGTHHLTNSLAERRLGELGRRLARLAHRRELHNGIGLEFEGRTCRGNGDVVAVVGERHRTRLQPPHDVGGEPGRNDTTSVVDPDHLVGHLDREVEVGSGHAQRVARARQEQAQEHRRRAAAPSDGAACRCQHLDECIALGSELHRRQSFRGVPQPFIAKEEVCVTCKGSKGCGLWTTYRPSCSAVRKMSPGRRGRTRPSAGRWPARSARLGTKGTHGPQGRAGGPTAFAPCKPQLGDVGAGSGGVRPSPHGSSG